MFTVNEYGFAIGGRARKFQMANFNSESLQNARNLLKEEAIAILEHGKQVWQKGYDLLLSIKSEPAVEKELKAIWDRKDADEYAKETAEMIAPRLTSKQIAELEKDLDCLRERSNKEHLTANQRREAKQQIALAIKQLKNK